MIWRRICIDLDDDGHILGASYELHEASQRDVTTVTVLSGAELDGHNVATLAEYLAFEVGPQPMWWSLECAMDY